MAILLVGVLTAGTGFSAAPPPTEIEEVVDFSDPEQVVGSTSAVNPLGVQEAERRPLLALMPALVLVGLGLQVGWRRRGR